MFTGIVRRIDDLGRVVIPKEIRRTLHIREGDPLEISVDGTSLILTKYRTSADYHDRFKEIVEDMGNDENISAEKMLHISRMLEAIEYMMKEETDGEEEPTDDTEFAPIRPNY